MKNITKKPGVYKITCLSNNKIYIGSSINLRVRINRHFNDLKKQKHPSNHLQNAFNKFGIENFTIDIIEEYETISNDDLLLVEQKYIDFFQSFNQNIGFNIYSIAGSPYGYKHSEETKRKISDALKGKPTGYVHKGEKRSKEFCEKMRIINTGVKHSEESIEKRARNYSFIDENGVIYQGKNLKRFCDEHNLDRTIMRHIINDKRKSHHGFKKH